MSLIPWGWASDALRKSGQSLDLPKLSREAGTDRAASDLSSLLMFPSESEFVSRPQHDSCTDLSGWASTRWLSYPACAGRSECPDL